MGIKFGVDALRDSVKEEEERAAQRANQQPRGLLTFFSWKKPGEKKILRFVSDEYFKGDFYDFIIDNEGNTKNFLADPDDPDRLQRFMSPTPGTGWQKKYKVPEPVEPTPKRKGVNIAVLREEVRVDGRTQIRDVIVDREDDDKVYQARVFGLVQQGVGNFWQTLETSCLSRYGTLCDRDYEITRFGDGFDTRYGIVPLPVDDELDSVEKTMARYAYGQEWDAQDPERFMKCPTTTTQWASAMMAESRYERLLGAKKDGSSPAPQQQHHPEGDPWSSSQQDEPQTGSAFRSLEETILARQNR